MLKNSIYWLIHFKNSINRINQHCVYIKENSKVLINIDVFYTMYNIYICLWISYGIIEIRVDILIQPLKEITFDWLKKRNFNSINKFNKMY